MQYIHSTWPRKIRRSKCLQKLCSHRAGGVLRSCCSGSPCFQSVLYFSMCLNIIYLGQRLHFSDFVFEQSFPVLFFQTKKKNEGAFACHKPVCRSPVELKCHLSIAWLRKEGHFFTLSARFWQLVDFFLSHTLERTVLQRLSGRSTIILSSWNEQIVSSNRSTSS